MHMLKNEYSAQTDVQNIKLFAALHSSVILVQCVSQ